MTDDRTDNDPFGKRVRRHVGGRRREYFAITTPGAEAWCRQELLSLGVGDSVRLVAGGVAFNGRFVDCQRANLHLRTATRILMRIDTFSATNRRQLEKHAAAIPWELFLPAGQLPRINVRSRQSRLYHTGVVADSLQRAISQCIGRSPRPALPAIPQTVFARALQDRYTISLDSSGDALYKRGLKEGPARAPIRETLAATLLMAAGYDTRLPLLDPMCGAGTFSLEAAMAAKGIPAGLNRAFAFMAWPVFSERQWAFLIRQAHSKIRRLPHPCIFASDVDPSTCSRLAELVDRIGFSDTVRVSLADFLRSRPPAHGAPPGLVAINPPYGIRLGSGKQADALLATICRHLVMHFKGWRLVLVTPRPELTHLLRLPNEPFTLRHGGITLSAIIGTIK